MAVVKELKGFIEKHFSGENSNILEEKFHEILNTIVEQISSFPQKHIPKDTTKALCTNIIGLSELFLEKQSAPVDLTISQLKEDLNLKFENMNTHIKNLTKTAERQSEELDLIDGRIHDTQKTILTNHKITYDCIKEAIGKKEDHPLTNKEYPIFIKRKISGSHDETRKKLFENLDCVKHNINIIRIKNIRDGGIILFTPTEEAQDVIFDHINKNDSLSEDFKIYIPNTYYPRIRINSVDSTYNSENILKTIRNQNPEVEERFFMRVITSFPQKKGTTWIISVEPELFNYIIHKTRLYIGFQSYKVEESIYVKRCLNCGQLGHTKKNCKENKDICVNCGDSGHYYKEDKEVKCHKTPCCINCKKSNANFKTEFNLNHLSLDNNCPTYLREKRFLQSRITYSD